jgi:hypothetical protein
MGTTSQYAWPYPEPAAPVRDGAAAIKALGDAIDLSHRGGFLSAVTDGSGILVVPNHGLGRMPKYAGVTATETGSGPIDAIGFPKIQLLNDAGMLVRVWRGDGSGVLAGNQFNVYWWVMG